MAPWGAGAASVMNHWPEWPRAEWCMVPLTPKVWFRFESLAWQDQPALALGMWMISPDSWMNWGSGSWDGGGWVFSSPLLNNKPSSSVVWLVVYQLGSVNGSAALPAVCWGWKVQDGDPTPEFGVLARLGNHWGCWLGLSVFMASLGFLTVSPSQSSLT